jgi:oligopeptide transport system substrate-binding protein
MKLWKRAAALLLSAVLCAGVLTGCADSEGDVNLSVCIGSGISTLDPIYAEDISSQTVLVHLYENLMKVVPDGVGGTEVANGMAKSVDVQENYDGSVTYTFRLRSARWSDGESVRAEDFVYAWRRLADPASFSPYAALLSVVRGYEEARAAGDMSLLEVTAKNSTTLVVTLNGNYDWFLREVCTSPATMPLRQDVVQRLKEAGAQASPDGKGLPWWNDPVMLVTNGPYLASDYQPETALELQVSERYHSGQLGPKTLTFRFAEDSEAAWELYDSREVDAVWPLTEERLAELAGEDDWVPIPKLSTYSVLYNCGSPVLEDALIRQAMAQVIDRNALAELAGVTALAAEGLVPPGVPENQEEDFRTVGGPLLDNDPEQYALRCQEAAELLSNAGYDQGSALGELEYLYVDTGNNGAVAEELCRQWKSALGIEVIPKGVTAQEMWDALRGGTYTLAGVDLEAPGNDAECFLMDWTSDSQDNVTSYENSAYDTLMSIIASAADGTARMGCLHDAEALLLGDYALSPLYTMGTDWELRDSLTGGARDARGWFDFAAVVPRSM